MRDRYDCIVVGAGPGGSWAARTAAEHGLQTLLLEKDREVGLPVRCAEGVGESSLKLVCDPRPEWIANVIEGVVFITPDKQEVVVDATGERGYVLERKIFDYALAMQAAESGVEIVTKAYVHGLLQNDGRTCGVRLRHLGRDYQIQSPVVIGADGLESRVGRFAGLRTTLKLKDIECCVQVTLSNIQIDPRYAYVYLGENVAPGGYLWIFPKNGSLANVGIGISGTAARQRSAMRYLEEFLSYRFPHASRMYTVVGGVPVAATLKRIVADGLMLVGDAAHQVNPVTGGGIVSAMQAGMFAGRSAAVAHRENDFSEKMFTRYVKNWHKAEGKTHERFHRIKEGISKLSDSDLNRVAGLLNALKPEQRTLPNIFKKALFQQPSLIVDVVRAFC